MYFSDILSLCISILGLYGLIYYLRFSIPRNILPSVSAVLTETEHLLDRAESTGVIPQSNDYSVNPRNVWRRRASANEPLPHYLTQLRQSILADADEKPSCSWDIAATPACCSVRPDIQAAYALDTTRGHRDTS